ncbi:MAG TPA: hypothetical protein VGK73_31075 [Polyangiaceae bacterium]
MEPGGSLLSCSSCCVEVSAPSARSCEIVLSGTPAGSTEFASEVRGTALAKGERFALAFTSRRDAALPRPAAAVGGPNGECPVEMTSATCYDREGHVIPSPGVSLRGQAKK